MPTLATAVLATLVTACSAKTGVHIDPVELNDAPPGAPMWAGYTTIKNHDDRARTLLRVQSTAYGSIEMHITELTEGKAKMRQEKQVKLPANGEVNFERFGRHLMLMQAQKLASDQPVLFEFCFADGECIEAPLATASP